MIKLNCIKLKRPLIVACSSSVITPELESKLNKIGFNIFIEQPLTIDKVNSIMDILTKM